MAALMLFATATVEAAPRTKQQMKEIAAQALAKGTGSRHNAPRPASEIVELQAAGALSIMGFTDGGFAVVAADDLVPAVLGVSQTRFSGTRNTSLQWWLSAMNEVVSHAVEQGTQLALVAPDPTKFPEELGPLTESKWDQTEPYDRMAPMFSTNVHCLTGCVATALSQVLYYHKTPAHGYGERTIYYKDQPVYSNFETTYWDWDNMLPVYKGVEYTDVQADAVAQLMHDCGVAVNMAYGGPSEGSGAYSEDAANGLREYFGFANAALNYRNSYGSDTWMDMLFTELNENGPVYYSGSDWIGGGHAFVVDGYNKDGLVSVNWGWSGDDDGFYDISLLNPSGYSFNVGQDFISGVVGEMRPLYSDTITTTAPGQLSDLLPDSLNGKLGSLKVCGPLNGDDILRLRQLAGRDQYGDPIRSALRQLDLLEATIVSGGRAYFVNNGKQLVTVDDEMPVQAFYGCSSLRRIVLPTSIRSFGVGAIGNCIRLEDVVIPNSTAERTFFVDGNTVWSNDTTTLICVLPMQRSTVDLPSDVYTISDFAFSGCSRLKTVMLPETVNSIGREAFSGCISLEELRVRSGDVPTLGGGSVFEGVKTSNCKLIVRSGLKAKYQNAAQWKDFTNITETGTAIIANNMSRKYGEKNPSFTYTVVGNAVSGKPSLSCSAKSTSPAGTYPIKVRRGTITADDVDFIDGYLIVKKINLKAKAASYTRYVGRNNPNFKVTVTGFINDDNVDNAITTMPYATCEATPDSPAGTYPIVVQGGEADNYNFTYINGTLTVKEDPSAIVDVNADTDSTGPVYDLNGRRIEGQSLRKGIYVQNGRKRVVR